MQIVSAIYNQWLCMIKYINDCINLELICSCTKKNCHEYLEFMPFWIIWSCVKWNKIAKIDALSIDPWSFLKLWQELWWSMIYPDLFMVAAADKMWLHQVSISSCTEQLLLWSSASWDIRRHAAVAFWLQLIGEISEDMHKFFKLWLVSFVGCLRIINMVLLSQVFLE